MNPRRQQPGSANVSGSPQTAVGVTAPQVRSMMDETQVGHQRDCPTAERADGGGVDSDMKGYWFSSDRLRDGTPLPELGVWIACSGQIVPCENGLHASEHPFDALTYAPGEILHRVELSGELVSHGDPVDKWAGRRRRILQTINAESILWEFVRWLRPHASADAPVSESVWGVNTPARAAYGAAAAAARAAFNAAYTIAAATPTDNTREAWEGATSADFYAMEKAGLAARKSAQNAQRVEFARLVDNAFGPWPTV